MEILNTQKDYDDVASIVVLIYGSGGTGKTTMASTFPKPLLLDFENGAKYFKQRGIDIDVVKMNTWFTEEDKKQLAKEVEKYDTIVLDPIGEAMDKLIKSDLISGSKYRQSGGDLTIAGWGKVKDDMRTMIKWMRDTNKHVVIIAHDEKESVEGSDGLIRKVPKMATKLAEELKNMVDIVGYLKIIKTKDDPEKRILIVDPADNGYIAKDRTGTLDKIIKPDFDYIYNQIKSKQKGAKSDKKTTVKKSKKVTEKEIKNANPFPKKK